MLHGKNLVNFANSADPPNYAGSRDLGEVLSAEFELAFVDFQGLDPRLQGRWWNPEPDRRSGRPGNAAPALGQSCLDHLSLGVWLAFRRRHGLIPGYRLRRFFGKPQFVD